MKSVIAFLFVALFFFQAVAALSDAAILAQFQAFETKYNKQYSSQEERLKRLSIFEDNLQVAAQLNAEQETATFGVTKFMDLSADEFKARYLNAHVPEQKADVPKLVVPVPEAVPNVWDWGVNKTGIVTPVKDQGQCGSCWAFSVTESVESAWALAGNTIQVLAPQQIVDCDVGGYDAGCNGGWTEYGFDYVIKAGGLELESSYPYTATDGTCKFRSSLIVSNITSWAYVSTNATTEDTDMLNYVAASGPVSVCVAATQWQTYTGGVLTKCSKQVDHCVQVTGISVQRNLPVWNVRNSWGADWGEAGYIWIERGHDLCMIASDVTVPTAENYSN